MQLLWWHSGPMRNGQCMRIEYDMGQRIWTIARRRIGYCGIGIISKEMAENRPWAFATQWLFVSANSPKRRKLYCRIMYVCIHQYAGPDYSCPCLEVSSIGTEPYLRVTRGFRYSTIHDNSTVQQSLMETDDNIAPHLCVDNSCLWNVCTYIVLLNELEDVRRVWFSVLVHVF